MASRSQTNLAVLNVPFGLREQVCELSNRLANVGSCGREHELGYTVFNDGSVRDYQRKTHQWTPGKNFDSTGAVGPVVVTPDELPVGARDLKIESRLNGRVMQSANTSDMMWPVAKTISTISEFLTLQPGDMIAMGTPPGVGHARNPPVFMKHGDVIEVEIEGIGVCRNPVVDEVAVSQTAAA